MVLAIYGASGLGREVLELAKVINTDKRRWDEFIFIDDGEVPAVVDGCEVYKFNVAKEKYDSDLEIVMGIGEPTTRGKVFQKIKSEGINTPSLIHPDVHIPETTRIGQGVIIQAGCFVSVGVTIENYVFLQPKCAVGHDCIIGEGCVISSFDSVAGAVHIGQYSYLGMGVSVKEQVSIGEYVIIGMGAIVFKDIPDEMIAMGNPARGIKKNEDRHVFKH